MRKIMLALALALSFAVYAQGIDPVQRSSNPLGMKIQGNRSTQAGSDALSSSANNVAIGEGSTVNSSAKNAKSGTHTQTQGNTTIKASAKNMTGVASGTNNAVGNEVGAIGK